MLRLLVAALIAVSATRDGRALDMNVHTDEQEKLAYVNMWGPIESGDDQKFRSLVLPYVNAGYLIYKVNIYSGGGSVDAAMAIGDQIRTLQARTVAPFKLTKIINNKKVITNTPTCSFDEAKGGHIYPRLVTGPTWCDCASACFLIWASGAVREGGYVGIHRSYLKGREFGQLRPNEAERKYKEAQARYTAYLKKLDVPQALIDRLFSTDSHSMYYLTWPDHQLMQSTPYLEEMTYSRCGQSKTEHMGPKNNWTMTEDIEHINCYRGF